MSTREQAFYIVNQLTDEQLDAFVTLFNQVFPNIPEKEPDEWDRAMIENSRTDNDEVSSLDDFVKELGFCPDELQI